MSLSYISNFDFSQCVLFALLSICSPKGPFVRFWFSFVRSTSNVFTHRLSGQSLVR